MFDVLSSDLNIHQSRLIEASAGTGKTFALEHLTLRWLLSKEEVSLDQIALITFTKKSAQDLKSRIRARFEKAYDELRLNNFSTPYLNEMPQERRDLALLRLIESLINFDLMPISTIHAFAAKLMSRSGWFLDSGESAGIEKAYLKQLVELHLEQQHLKNKKSGNQSSLIVELVRKVYSWNVDRLTDDLLKILTLGLEIDLQESLDEQTLRGVFDQATTFPSADFLEMYSSEFNGLYNKKGLLKPFLKRLLKTWQQTLYEKRFVDIDDIIHLMDLFGPDKLKKKSKEEAEKIALWMQEKKVAWSFLSEQSIKKKGLGSLAKQLKKSLAPLFKTDFRLGHDVILKKLEETLDSSVGPSLAKTLKLLIVDEFQDTDPVQWRLFQKLAKLNPSLQIILVGDPKQSIYGFRQADIYTYMQAKGYVEKDLKGSLDELKTNYRSHPRLIKALNALFADPKSGNWLRLPRIQSFLACPKVSAGRKEEIKTRDPRLFFHDLSSHETSSLPEAASIWIDAEVHRLRSKGCKKFAILVSSNQLSRQMQELLEERGHRCSIQKPLPFVQLKSFDLFKLILEAFDKPYMDGLMKKLWSHPIWGLCDDEIESILDTGGSEALKEKETAFSALFWQKVTKLHLKLKDKGVGAFLKNFWSLEVHDLTFFQRLKQSLKGQEIYDQIHSLWLWLESQNPSLLAIEALDLMSDLEKGHFKDTALYYPQQLEDFIDILTVHSSKGLEYEVVFCLSNLPQKPPQGEKWTAIYKEKGSSLAFELDSQSVDYLSACDEIDAEKARRLYVAWTRSREYLLVGYSSSKNKIPKRGQASPLDLFKASWQEPEAKDFDQWYKALEKGDEGLWLSHLKKLEEERLVGLTDAFSIKKEAFSQKEFVFQERKNSFLLSEDPGLKEIKIEPSLWQRGSFSSLLQSMKKLQISEEIAKNLFEERPLVEGVHEPSEVEDVPRGTETGVLWHFMFQKSLQLLQNRASITDIFDYLTSPLFLKTFSQFGTYSPWIEVMANQVVKLLDMDWAFKSDGKKISFNLKNLSPGSIWTEKNFELDKALAQQKLEGFIQIGKDPIQLKGVIDGVISLPEGVVFIDWKSNSLFQGSYYHQEAVLKNAQDHRYDLQALIYQTALEASSLVTPNKPLLAGLYVYLRGPVFLTWSPHKRSFLIESERNQS